MANDQEKRDMEWIINLIHSEYDPIPKDWPRHSRNDWDDGTKSISEQIVKRFNSRR
jgi:hypothetical protein